MTKKEMTDNIVKLFGNNHAWTYQFFSIASFKDELIIKFYYDRMIESEKENVKQQIEKLQKRLDELNEM